MKKLAMSAFLVMLLFGSAFAHNGAISLYTDATIATCNATIAALQTDTVRIYYVRSAGARLGPGVEFRMTLSTDVAFVVGTEWSTAFNAQLGDLESGIALSAGACFSATANVVYLGEVYIMLDYVVPAPSFTANIVDNPDAIPYAGIWITWCDAKYTMHPVLGGTFVFNGSCNPGVETKSWGAIKELFK